MTFTVTCRGADGALREEAVDAASRAECFAQMRARGIVPVSVKEGASLEERASRPFRSRAKTGPRNAQDARCPSGGGKPQSSILNLKSLIILAAVLAAAAGAWLWLASRPAGPEVPRAAAAPQEAEAAPASRGGARPGDPRRPAARGRTFRAQGAAKVATNAVPPEIGSADVFLEPKIRGRLIEISPPPGMIFTNAFENFIADILTAKPGERFLEVEVGDWFDEAFVEALKSPTGVLPDDSEAVAATKTAVAEARASIAEHVRAGGSPREVVLEARAELNKIADYRDRLQEGFHGLLLQEDDPEILRMYVTEANDMLKEYGALPLDAPDDDESMAELIRDYRELDETNRSHEQAEKERKEKERLK